MLVYFLVLVLFCNSFNCWAENSPQVDRVIATSKESSQRQMEVLFTKMFQGLPADRQEQLVLQLENGMDNFYRQEGERLSQFPIPQFKKRKEAILYFDTEEKKLLAELQGLKDEVQRLKDRPAMNEGGGAYRSSRAKENEKVQILIENISARSQTVAQHLHQLMLAQELGQTKGIKKFVEYYENLIGTIMLGVVTLPPFIIAQVFRGDEDGTDHAVMAVMATTLFFTVPALILLVQKLDSPPNELMKKIANHPLLSGRWKKRTWEANLKAIGKIDGDFEVMVRDFMARAHCTSAPQIRVDPSIPTTSSRIRVDLNPTPKFRIDLSPAGTEALQEAEEIIPAVKRSMTLP